MKTITLFLITLALVVASCTVPKPIGSEGSAPAEHDLARTVTSVAPQATPTLQSATELDDTPLPPGLQATLQAMDQTGAEGDFDTAIDTLAALLAEQEPDAYGGLWMEYNDGYHAVVGFSPDGEASISRHVAASPYANRIELHAVSYPLKELERAKLSLFPQVIELGFDAIGYIDLPTNRVVFEVLSKDEVLAALEETGIELPPYVAFIEVGSMITPEN